MRLGTRFLLIFLALSLGPLLAVFVLAYANGRRTIEESLGRLFELKATQAIGALDHEVARLQSTGRAWAALEWMQDVLTDDVDGRVTTFLIQQPRQQPLLAGARVTNAVGTVIAASRPEWVGELARAPAESEPDDLRRRGRRRRRPPARSSPAAIRFARASTRRACRESCSSRGTCRPCSGTRKGAPGLRRLPASCSCCDVTAGWRSTPRASWVGAGDTPFRGRLAKRPRERPRAAAATCSTRSGARSSWSASTTRTAPPAGRRSCCRTPRARSPRSTGCAGS